MAKAEVGPSEFGGYGGLIQPEVIPGLSDGGNVIPGHSSRADTAADRRGVRDAAMVLRTAGWREAHGETLGPTGALDSQGFEVHEHYGEEDVRQELTGG
jgi:hypothetical protein